MNISYTIVSDTVTPDIRARLARVQNPEPALRRMGQVLVNFARQAFRDTSKRPAAWPNLAPRTLAQKKKKGYGSKPLIASGALARSPRVISVTRNEVVVGSDRRSTALAMAARTKSQKKKEKLLTSAGAGGNYSLAAIHQLGAPRRHIPARPFFPFQNGQTMPAARDQVTAVLRAWLNAGR